MDAGVLDFLDTIWKIGVALGAAFVFVLRLESKLKALTREVETLSGEYKSMISEYRKLNELYLEMRTQVNANTKGLDELQLLKAAWIAAKTDG